MLIIYIIINLLFKKNLKKKKQKIITRALSERSRFVLFISFKSLKIIFFYTDYNLLKISDKMLEKNRDWKFILTIFIFILKFEFKINRTN